MWNASNELPFSRPSQSLVKLQHVLDDALPHVVERDYAQQADLLLSRAWLKLVVWQLCVSKTLLCSSGPEESLSFQFPFSVARSVVQTAKLLPLSALEANGVGILEKIFDVGCSLADVLSLSARTLTRESLEVGPGDYLREIMRLVETAAGGSPRHLRVLASKAEEYLQWDPLSMLSPGYIGDDYERRDLFLLEEDDGVDSEA